MAEMHNKKGTVTFASLFGDSAIATSRLDYRNALRKAQATPWVENVDGIYYVGLSQITSLSSAFAIPNRRFSPFTGSMTSREVAEALVVSRNAPYYYKAKVETSRNRRQLLFNRKQIEQKAVEQKARPLGPGSVCPHCA